MTRAGAVYQLVIDRENPPENLRLRNVEWGVLFALDNERPVGEILQALRLSEEEGEEIFKNLRDRRLIEERTVSYKEYVAAQTKAGGAGRDEPVSLAEFLFSGTLLSAAGAGKPSPKEPVSPPPPPPLSPQPVGVAAAAPQARSALTAPHPHLHPPRQPQLPATAPAPVPPREPGRSSAPAPRMQTRPITFRPLGPSPRTEAGSPAASRSGTGRSEQPSSASLGPRPSSQPQPAPTPTPPMAATSALPDRRLSLKNVIDFIMNRAPDLNAGQLDVYRVFIRINTQLLKRNGIHSLRFTDDRTITDPELQQAILGSIQRTLGASVPDDVFV